MCTYSVLAISVDFTQQTLWGRMIISDYQTHDGIDSFFNSLIYVKHIPDTLYNVSLTFIISLLWASIIDYNKIAIFFQWKESNFYADKYGMYLWFFDNRPVCTYGCWLAGWQKIRKLKIWRRESERERRWEESESEMKIVIVYHSIENCNFLQPISLCGKIE